MFEIIKWRGSCPSVFDGPGPFATAEEAFRSARDFLEENPSYLQTGLESLGVIRRNSLVAAPNA